MATRSALGRRAFVHVTNVTTLAFDFGVLECQWKTGLLAVKDLQRLLRHAFLTRLRMTPQALVISIFPAVRLLVLVTA